jgi:hypothetical protein
LYPSPTMEIFFRLLFGHLLADFTFQTNYLAGMKRRSMLGLFIHVLIHPVCYILLTWPYLNEVWFFRGGISLIGWAVVPILALLHFVEDWFRIGMVNRGWPDNTVFYLWDQIIHIILLWVFSPIKVQGVISMWPLLGILLVLVTHCATVTIWFIEKDIYGRDYPDTEEKYISILQRLVVWLAFFMPDPWWLLVLLFVLVTFGRHVWTRRVDFSWTSVILGNSLAIICGAFSRFGLNYHF